MRAKNFDIIAMLIIVGLNIGWVKLFNGSLVIGGSFVINVSLVIGTILALPLIFFIPGYALTQVLSGYRSVISQPTGNLARSQVHSGRPVTAADRVALSFGLSITIDILVGFTLNILPTGLNAFAWTLSLGLIIIILALLAAFQRRKGSVQSVKVERPRPPISRYILFGLAVIIATTAIWLSVNRPLNPQPSYTQFWMLPGKSSNCEVQIGVQNFEITPLTYRIVIKINSKQLTTWPSIVLAPQQEWSHSLILPPGSPTTTSVEAQLYRADKPETVYRDVHITLGENKDGKMQC